MCFRLHSGKGSEFLVQSLESFCKNHGIHRTTTAEYGPPANGAGEEAVGFVKRKSRHLLTGARLPTAWWGVAAIASGYYSRCAAGLMNWPSIPFGTRAMVGRTK